MNKHYLFRKASVIHAIKCNNGKNLEIGIQSFDTLSGFKARIQNAIDETELTHLNDELDAWAVQEPIAPQTEINNLIHKK